MPTLEQIDGHEDGKQVHVGRVKLEVHVRRAHVVAGGHDPNHEEGQTHRVEEREGGAGSRLMVRPISICFRNFTPQLKNSWPSASGGWLQTHLLKFSPHHNVLLHHRDYEEEKTKEHVTHIAQDVVPHCKA